MRAACRPFLLGSRGMAGRWFARTGPRRFVRPADPLGPGISARRGNGSCAASRPELKPGPRRGASGMSVACRAGKRATKSGPTPQFHGNFDLFCADILALASFGAAGRWLRSARPNWLRSARPDWLRSARRPRAPKAGETPSKAAHLGQFWLRSARQALGLVRCGALGLVRHGGRRVGRVRHAVLGPSRKIGVPHTPYAKRPRRPWLRSAR